MMLESENFIIRKTQITEIDRVLQIEKDNSEFLCPYSKERHVKSLSDPDELDAVIVRKEDNRIIGGIILAGLKNENNVVEFRRIVLAEKGQGYGRACIKLIKKFCFEELGCHKLWLDVHELNARAKALYESEGFVLEGKLRECIKKDNGYISLFVMSVLRQEYLNSLCYNDSCRLGFVKTSPFKG